MNNTEAFNMIYKHLKAGHKFGKWIDNVRYPYFEVNLVMSPDEKYWRWQNYGSSANRANKKELKWVIETIFKMKPVDFLEEYQCRDESLKEVITMETITLEAKCAVCGRVEEFELTEKETETFCEYFNRGREMGMLQDLFPRVPAWIRAGAIDQFSGGFCICPDCSGMEV